MSDNKIFQYLETIPEIDESVFLAPGVKIIGNVKIEKDSSIWFNTVVRGDVNYITIGKKTNVQDLSMLHVTANEFPLIIGDEVTIGHSVTLHGCILKDRTFIGMGATILDGATVENDSMVAAGAVVRQGFTVPSGKLVAGVPAKIIRDLTLAEVENISESAERYIKYAKISGKSFK
ncbi:MAG: gamma carbonic anhydrase family protein [Melioribacteraceae bacterium]|jgi:carbonic anhydrase/acetyltransferase-like protein (isoleucine patch superfamily)|nr:gamma carbonic anhydrase family protein [Melioribacteraceae bacterium]